jgi:AraC-like DNA-binding protein
LAGSKNGGNSGKPAVTFGPECLAPRDLRSDGEHEHVTLAKLLNGYQEIVVELGGEPERMLQEARIEASSLVDPNATVSLRALGQLLEDTAAQLGCPDLGLRLAERQSMLSIMQPLDKLFCTAPTIRDTFECCSRHMGAYNSGLIMELEDGFASPLSLLHLDLIDGLARYPQFIEQLVLLTHKSAIWLSAGFARSRAVWFSHLNISPPVAYARYFNAVVKFGQEYDGLFFGAEDLQTSVVNRNPEAFASEARIIAQLFPERRKEIEMRVWQAVFRTLTSCERCTRLNVARLVGLEERTLNRHLSQKGTSFESIRDEVRKSLAFRYLARADLTLTDIAGRLGYSELAVLSRSCRRWFGTSPRQLRHDLVADRPEARRCSKPALNGTIRLVA